MTRCLFLWIVAFAAISTVGMILDLTYLKVLPLVLPVIWADQWMSTHYQEEEQS